MSALSELAGRYDHFLLDLDGCVYVGDEPTPRAVEAIEALRVAGKDVAFVTNDGRHGTEEYVRKLWRLGFRASLEEVVTVGGAIQFLLAASGRWRHAYVVGSAALHRHVADAGVRIVNGSEVPPPEVVVVGAHDDLTYAELRGATQAVLRGADLVCAGRDATFPMPDGLWPGTGAIVAALETATGVRAINAGKPEAQPFFTALDRLGAAPADGRALVVGDRLDADLGGARAAGLDGAIVLSGATDRATAVAEPLGEEGFVAIADTLADLLLAA